MTEEAARMIKGQRCRRHSQLPHVFEPLKSIPSWNYPFPQRTTDSWWKWWVFFIFFFFNPLHEKLNLETVWTFSKLVDWAILRHIRSEQLAVLKPFLKSWGGKFWTKTKLSSGFMNTFWVRPTSSRPLVRPRFRGKITQPQFWQVLIGWYRAWQGTTAGFYSIRGHNRVPELG